MGRPTKNGTNASKLNRDAICRAAVAVIHDEGLEELSMRKIACLLNIKAASLYNHVRNKGELLALVQEEVFSKLEAPTERHDWQVHLRQLASALRKMLLSQPRIVPLFALHPLVTNSGLKQAEQSFGVLSKAGFAAHEVVFIYQTLSCFVLGHALSEISTTSEGEEEDDGAAKVNSADFPNISAAYTYDESSDLELWFSFGLEALISGWERSLGN